MLLNIEQVSKWAALYKEARESLEDDHRSKRKIMAYMNKNTFLIMFKTTGVINIYSAEKDETITR